MTLSTNKFRDNFFVSNETDEKNATSQNGCIIDAYIARKAKLDASLIGTYCRLIILK